MAHPLLQVIARAFGLELARAIVLPPPRPPDPAARAAHEAGQRERNERRRVRAERRAARAAGRRARDRCVFGEELWGTSAAQRDAGGVPARLARFGLPALETEAALAEWLGIA